MNDSKVTFIGISFLALCLGLVGGIYFLDGQIRTSKAQYDALEQRRANLERERDNLREQIAVFKEAFSELENYNVRAATSDMDFYSHVQLEIDPYINRNEVVIVSQRQRGLGRDGRNSIHLILRGDYYSFMKILAAWRNLPVTVRVAGLDMTATRTPQTRGEIQAEVTLEAIVAR